ncbi:nuclear transport factor 2-like [Solanum dulcamara]|uniref:nuclear transport factor 2-like n=1 Tax=Solanum dulcamara TaxID=45834 RepID=UPI0024857BB8|nr:nuclear transport factor 2-like [Solanum dulcamara]
MATQSTRHAAENVATAFVVQYYNILQKLIDQSYRFYKERSVLSWPLPDGEIKSVTTSQGINDFIISSHFKDSKVEVITIDSQSSMAGGVLVMVTACLIGQDESKKRFSQTFFLAPQETGYYVMNDIFRFIGEEESSTIVEENVLVDSPLAIGSKDENIVDQVGHKPSLTSNQKEQKQKEAPKISYASMIKQGRPSPPTNAPHKIVRVVTITDLPSTPKKIQQPNNNFVQAPTITQDNSNDIQYKSIYIGGLPSNTTRNDLYAIVKEFGPVHTHEVQLKTYEDGYCCGFVHFQDAISAKNAVQTHYIIVKGKRAYIRFKRPDKVHGERRNSPSEKGEFRGGRRPQSSDGRWGEGYKQNYMMRDQRGGGNYIN